MARVQFPEGFHWGTASAAYPTEGSPRADGKAESIWDHFTHRPATVRNGETADVACDGYRRFTDDVTLMRELGLTSHRFSISWPRVLSGGDGAVNPRGMDHYSRLVDTLLAAEIRPLPTLYHWDLPQLLQQRGGWPLRDTAGRFADYADRMARALGDRVNDWVLFDAPFVFTWLGYGLGVHAPGIRDSDAFLRASHTVNLAQGEAFRAIRATSSEARIGTAFSLSPCEPAGDREEDSAASERWHGFANLWFLETALRGRYPNVMGDELPAARMGILDGDFERMRAPLDFIGVNCFSRTFVEPFPGDPLGVEAKPIEPPGTGRGPRTETGWEVWPDALYDIVTRVSQDYETPVLEITANGCGYGDSPTDTGGVEDPRRIEFHHGYLEALARAIDGGADVRGYHAWSLLDQFEWTEGYNQRFGLVHVDFESGRRTLKASGRWYARLADSNGFDT
ncbi:GH1 family beta-glucosidase [Myxococcota bacterium]|nr:GH1 family beta-glucosidase [Myxococcota bacterium]